MMLDANEDGFVEKAELDDVLEGLCSWMEEE